MTDAVQPQDLVLTVFGSHVRRPGARVWAGGMVEILEGLGFTTGSARAALARLVNRDLLQRTRHGRLAFYSTTGRAEDLLRNGDRRIFSFGRTQPSTELWTVLWHSIPETRRIERSRFASRLRFLGFGSIQDATWVAPRDREQEVRALLAQLAIEPYTSVLVGRMFDGMPPVALVAQAWRLDILADRYRSFLEDFEPLRTASARRRLSSDEAFRRRILALHRFRGFASMDPELPSSVDSVRDLRERVVACFDDVYRTLDAPATEYFWKVAEAPGSRHPNH